MATVTTDSIRHLIVSVFLEFSWVWDGQKSPLPIFGLAEFWPPLWHHRSMVRPHGSIWLVDADIHGSERMRRCGPEPSRNIKNKSVMFEIFSSLIRRISFSLFAHQPWKLSACSLQQNLNWSPVSQTFECIRFAGKIVSYSSLENTLVEHLDKLVRTSNWTYI